MVVKRVFDIVVSLFFLIAGLPAWVLLMILIKSEDGGPVFFIQERIGLRGKKFRMYKFRSMSQLPMTEKGSFHAGDTSRVTHIGRFIRKTKFDEFPQLLNVLIGDMSIVGPRPEVEKWVQVYPERWIIVHQVKPGITDNASVIFRNEEELLAASDDPEGLYRTRILPEKLTLYEGYVKEHSVLKDVRIILNTFYAIVS